MNRLSLLITLFVLVVLQSNNLVSAEFQNNKNDVRHKFAPTDWPWWRGPDRNGVARPDQKPPLQWSNKKNIIWKTPVPGRGHSSPTIVGDRIYLSTADDQQQIQSVICFDKKTGKQLWKTDIHKGGIWDIGKRGKKENKRSSKASPTVACDGERLFINFKNRAAVYTTALDLDGRKLWQKKITNYVTHQGYGSSPAIYGSLVIVSADNKGGGAIAGLNRRTGKIVWKQLRPKTPNYPSPIILRVAGRDQLFMTGCDLVSSFDPQSGKKLWEIKGSTTETITSTVTDGRVIITSGGYPDNHISAVLADGSGKVLWRIKTRVYVPSMQMHRGHLYTVTDAGVAICTNCTTGKEAWSTRLGGIFNASPVLVGDLLFATNQEGQTFIYKATPKAFTPIAQNQLGEDVFATPTICDSKIYIRVGIFTNDGRREFLYCIGKK